MSYGLVCLRCRAYLSACRCERPMPSANARTPLDGVGEDGVDLQAAAMLISQERAAEEEQQRRASLPRAERRRLEREELKRSQSSLPRYRR